MGHIITLPITHLIVAVGCLGAVKPGVSSSACKITIDSQAHIPSLEDRGC